MEIKAYLVLRVIVIELHLSVNSVPQGHLKGRIVDHIIFKSSVTGRVSH